MLDPNEAAFLHSIAADSGDDTARLVFADWLDERGEAARAEFIRVQCELIRSEVTEERRRALLLRERALLDAHRRSWCQAFGLPVEDVQFERGLVSQLRLSGWDGGKMLAPEHAPHFAPLAELDLSGLAIGDAGLAAFAAQAQLPALRTLILSENNITDAGATALAQAQGLPRLETIYLFQNSISPGAQTALRESQYFRLTNLDVGAREEGYCMSAGETDVARRQYVRTHLWPIVAQHFATHERLQSAMLCVAQYWADEADDAVHASLVVSELFEPTLVGMGTGDRSATDPNIPNTFIKDRYGEGSSSEISLWDANVPWDDNTGSIPLWAGFAPEGGSQDYNALSESYAPAVMFYRHGGHTILPMWRPHLDGVRPEWGWED